MMEIKSIPFECKANVDKYEFEGYASTYKKDLVGDQVVQGAFKKTLAERLPINKIKILWEHREGMGKPLEMYEDSKGLYVRGKISETQQNKDRLILMKDGVVDEMSIGYDVLQDELSADGSTRLLKELKLYEVSVVQFGANPDTSIMSAKSLDLILDELQPARLEKLLTKEGRTLSARNLQRLQQARTHIDEILALIEKDPEDETAKSLRQIGSTLSLFGRSQQKSTQNAAHDLKDLEAALNPFTNLLKRG
jgi:HK97 family phage prohead protease